MRVFFIISIFICVSVTLKSQIVFQGAVKDDEGSPLIYANIIFKTNRAGTSSNKLGNYKIELNQVKYKYDTIIVSFVGYKTKKIPVILIGNQKLNIVLNRETYLIDNATVIAEKPKYTALQIVEKAIKNIKKNYTIETVVQEGFYREHLKENGISSKINECSFNYKSSPYPQAKYSKESFNDYWADYWGNSHNQGRLIGFSDFVQHWPLFVTLKDKVYVIKSRVSTDRPSIDGAYQTGSPYGGPIDVLALNNVKFKFDFANPKLTNKYNYKIVGKKIVDKYYCYIISYAPKDTSHFRYNHHYGKKVSRTLFKGEITIKEDDFSIVSFTSESIDWYNSINHILKDEIFKTYNPNKIKFSVTYQKADIGWILQNIKYTSNYNSTYKNSSNYIWQRELYLSLPKDTSNLKVNDADYFPIRRESLRDRTNSYDSTYWHDFEKNNLFIPLTTPEKNDLGDILPLETQFKLLNQTIKEIPKPNFINNSYIIYNNESNEIKDTLKYNNYLADENTYADIVLQKINNYKREFNSYSLLHRDIGVTSQNQKPKYFVETDSLSIICYFETLNETKTKSILNLSLEYQINKNGHIEDIGFGEKYITLLINFDKEIGKVLKIKEKSKACTIDSICNVNEFFNINDSTFIYTQYNNANRVSKLFLHKKGSKVDSLLINVNDAEYDIEMYKTTSNKYIIIDITSKNQNEIWAFNKSNLNPQMIHSRSERSQILTDHFNDDNFFVSLISKSNSIVVNTKIENLHNDTILVSNNIIDNFYQFENILLYTEYNKFDMKLMLFDYKTNITTSIEPQKGFNYIELIKNESVRDSVSFFIESVINPFQEFKINIKTGKFRMIDEIKFAYSTKKRDYKSEIIEIKNKEGLSIPILIFYDAIAIKDSVTAILIESYGAYGGINISSFDERNIELLSKGFVIAQPAVRGGGTLGQDWYYAGKQLNKKNTFDDFITATRALKKKYNLPQSRVFAKGVSAGGLIMGVMVNEHSDEFGGIILDRPFLDVYNSMKDSTKFLTTIEYQEWGNPNDSIVDKYIYSYSPFQNITQKKYTNLFFRASENDFVTPVTQIAASVLKYRENSKADNLILLKIDKSEGHMVRYSNSRVAEEYSFMMYVINSK